MPRMKSMFSRRDKAAMKKLRYETTPFISNVPLKKEDYILMIDNINMEDASTIVYNKIYGVLKLILNNDSLSFSDANELIEKCSIILNS